MDIIANFRLYDKFKVTIILVAKFEAKEALNQPIVLFPIAKICVFSSFF